VVNINRYTLALGFSGDRLDAEVTEHTGLMHARFGGSARDGRGPRALAQFGLVRRL
jgi:hypothetical protein